MKSLALITGASSGIGRELARVHAAANGDVIAVARSEKALIELRDELSSVYGARVHVIALDLFTMGAAETLAQHLSQERLVPDILINNAGIGAFGTFSSQPLAVLQDMLQLNIVTLAELTRLMLPGMQARGSGRILQVASAAAFMPGPLQASYYATKAFVLSLSEALAIELDGSGVSVTTLCPGATDSGFLQRAGGPNQNIFRAQSSHEVAKFAYKALLRGQAVAIPGKLLRLTLATLPRSVLAAMAYRRNRDIVAVSVKPSSQC